MDSLTNTHVRYASASLTHVELCCRNSGLCYWSCLKSNAPWYWRYPLHLLLISLSIIYSLPQTLASHSLTFTSKTPTPLYYSTSPAGNWTVLQEGNFEICDEHLSKWTHVLLLLSLGKNFWYFPLLFFRICTHIRNVHLELIMDLFLLVLKTFQYKYTFWYIWNWGKLYSILF